MSINYDLWCIRGVMENQEFVIRNSHGFVIESRKVDNSIAEKIYPSIKNYELWIVSLFFNDKTDDITNEEKTGLSPKELNIQLASINVYYAFVAPEFDQQSYIEQDALPAINVLGVSHPASPYLEEASYFYISDPANKYLGIDYKNYNYRKISSVEGSCIIEPEMSHWHPSDRVRIQEQFSKLPTDLKDLI